MIKIFTDAKRLKPGLFSIGFVSACGNYSAFKIIDSTSDEAEKISLKYAIECMEKMLDVTIFYTDSESAAREYNGYLQHPLYRPAVVNKIEREKNIANTWLRSLGG